MRSNKCAECRWTWKIEDKKNCDLLKQSIYCDTDVWKYSISVNQCYINLWSLGHRAKEMTRINEDESRNNQVTSLKESEMHLKVWSFSKFWKATDTAVWHCMENTTKLYWRKYGEHILIFMKVVAAPKLFHIMKTLLVRATILLHLLLIK